MTNLYLDTSVLLSGGTEVFDIDGDINSFNISYSTLDDLSRLKDDPRYGQNAREVINQLDKISQSDELVFPPIRFFTGDILFTCKTDSDATILSTNPVARIQANTQGIPTATFIPAPKAYRKGTQEIQITDQQMNELYSNGEIRLEEDVPSKGYALAVSSNASALVKCDREYRFELVKDDSIKTPRKTITGRNMPQRFAINAAHDFSTPFSVFDGVPGGGKTFIAVSAGLEALLSGKVDRLKIFKSLAEVDMPMGYLPGTLDEKMAPRVRNVMDILYDLESKTTIDKLIAEEKIQILPLSYIRGESWNSTFAVVDEAQNLDYNSLKTCLTRSGSGTKVILSMDTEQADIKVNHDLPVVQIINKMYFSKYFSHIYFEKSERSDAAEEAAKLL